MTDEERTHPETGKALARGVRSVTLTQGSQSETIDIPSWYPADDPTADQGIHSAEDLYASDRAIERMRVRDSSVFSQRAAEKAASRAKDEADMASGAVSKEDMARINGGGVKNVRYVGPSARIQALAERVKLPEDQWERVGSPEEFTQDAREYLKDLVSTVPGLRGGRPVIRGLRITVGDVLGWLASGMSETEILAEYPELTQTDIQAALTHAADAREYLGDLDCGKPKSDP